MDRVIITEKPTKTKKAPRFLIGHLRAHQHHIAFR